VTIGIDDCLAPSYFVSYSRRQEAIARMLKEAIAEDARATWFDRDSILVGDAWFEEIRTGIAGADEVVLVLSEDSLASEAVAKEVELARAGGKLIRPIAVTPLSRERSLHISTIHFLDVSDALDDPDLLRVRLRAHFGAMDGDDREDVRLKLFATRSVWPPFTEALVSPAGRDDAQDYASRLVRLAEPYKPASPIRLNAGLAMCMAGQWREGVAQLTAYAEEANNFAGWYFLALHALRREPVASVSLDGIKLASRAIGKALRLGDNPLALLTAAVIETGGSNLGPVNLERRMAAMAAALGEEKDPPSEYLRAFWCLKPSLRVLGRYEEPVRNLVRELMA